MSLFTKISLRIGLCVLVGFALPLGTAGTVDDAQSFALQASEPYVKEGFQVREDYWAAISAPVKRKPCGNSCLKETNTGSGWVPKSNARRFPSTFMIRKENWPNNQTVGKKAILRLRT